MSFNLNKTALFAALTSSALLMGAAQAATNAQVTITGQIAAATCDLNVTKNNIDLGTFVPTGILANSVITGSSENFTLNLSDCTHDYDTTLTGNAVNLYAKGTALAANTAYFNNQNGATVGVKLTADGTAVKPNTATNIASLTGLITGGSAAIPMTAELFSTVATPDAQMIEAPITFSVAYN